MKIAKRSEKAESEKAESEKAESKNRPVATNFQFSKILAPLGQLLVGGVPAPNPARNEYSKLELIYFVCKSSRKKIPSVRLTNISLSLIT